jgi:DNA replication protein DnaC
LLDRESANRQTRRFQSRLRAARLRHNQASVEDVDYRTPRRLDKALFQQLATSRWIAEHRNLLVTGPCGIGKSWLACALAQKACRDGYTVHYARVPRLFADLELAHGDGRFPRLFRILVKSDLLVLDDWGPDRLSASQRRDLMEIVEDRYGRGATLITSQLPVSTWHEVIGEPTLGDAILDRIVHNAYRLDLDGPSMRKVKADQASEPAPATDTKSIRESSAPLACRLTTNRKAEIANAPDGACPQPHTGRDRLDQVVAIRRNDWARSSECALTCHQVRAV